MIDRVQWKDLSGEERSVFTYIVGLIVEEDFDIVHNSLIAAKHYNGVLDALLRKGLIVDVPVPPGFESAPSVATLAFSTHGGAYGLGPEGKRLAMLHKLAPQFHWEAQ